MQVADRLHNHLKLNKFVLEKVDHPDVLHSLDSLAANYSALGKYQEAGELYERTLKIREEKSCINESCIYALNGKAFVHYALGQNDKAIATYEKALDQYKVYVEILINSKRIF